MIPQKSIDAVSAAIKLEDVVGKYVTLQKKGPNFVGCCPFHNEKTASFVVSPAKGVYKCFGCGEGGKSVFKFIEKVEQLTFPEAVEFLAKDAGVKIERTTDEKELRQLREREGLMLINQKAQAFWAGKLKAHSAYKYFTEERGFTDKDIKQWGIGVSMNLYNDLLGELASSGYNAQTLELGGLAGRSNTGNYYDRFRDRLMFPITNLTGQVIGFTGRILNDPEKKLAKYMNSPDTLLFNKTYVLYGLHLAKKAIGKEGRANLVEGNTDVIRMHQVGVTNTVATSGTAFTVEQAKLIKRFTNNLTILYDGDSAGRKAARKAGLIASQANLNVCVCFLEAEDDPDTFFRGKAKQEAKSWIEANEKNYWEFRTGEIAALEVPAERAEAIRELLEDLKNIGDPITFNETLKFVNNELSIDPATYKLEKMQEEIGDGKITGLYGFDEEAKAAIKDADEVWFYLTKEEVLDVRFQGKENALGFNGIFDDKELGELKALTKNFYFDFQLDDLPKLKADPPDIEHYKFLTVQRFDIKVDNPKESGFMSFTDWYFRMLADNIERYDPESQKDSADKSVSFLSKLDKTIQGIMMPQLAKQMGMAKADYARILKPLVSKEDNRATQKSRSIVIDGVQRVFDINNLPDYVDQEFFNKYRHFPAEDSKGKRIFYVFSNEYGTLATVGNFYMEPKFQVYHEDRTKNKRIVEIHSQETPSKLLEIPSDDLIDLMSFRKFLFRQGPYLFTGLKAVQMEMILESIVHQFPLTYEFENYGTQEEGFFAFINGIITDDGIRMCDEMGLVTFKDKTYYSPAVSRIFDHYRGREHTEKFGMKVYLKIKKPNDITFKMWSELFAKVYQGNNNHMWGLTMALMCGFRSNIFPIMREFTTLFFSGGTGSGKSKLAQSIRALYMDPEAPMFNLNSGTDAAFFSLLELFEDIPVVMEEYNDIHISDIKFQGLKAAVFDGEGRSKRKNATSNDLVTTKVLGVPILLGQESPERDDRSLGNRCVECQVPQVKEFTDEQVADFNLLKAYEQTGITHLLVQVLSQRKHIKANFKDVLIEEKEKLRAHLRENGVPFVTRVCNSVAFFTAFVRTWETYVPQDLKLPFSYAEFFPIAAKKVEDQSESINNTNRVSVFFDALMTLANKGDRDGIKDGRDYKIETKEDIKVREGGRVERQVVFDAPVQILYLQLGNIHPRYKQLVGAQEHLHMTNLLNYLKDHPSFVGSIKQTEFMWQEETRVSKDGETVTSRMTNRKVRTSAMALNYTKLQEMYQFDLGVQHFVNEPVSIFSVNGNATTENGGSGATTAVVGSVDDKPDDGLPF